MSISDSTFAKNVAKMNGGGINGGGNLGIFSNSKFEYNTAEVCGGAINWYASEDTVITGSTFTNNSANAIGGAINWRGYKIDYSTFIQNTAIGSGGAVYWNTTEGEVRNSNFIENKAKRTLTDNVNMTTKNLVFALSGETYLNAIFVNQDITFDNVTYWDGNRIVNSNQVAPSKDNQSGSIINIEIYKNGTSVVNVALVANATGEVSYGFTKLGGNFTYVAYCAEDTYYAYAETEGTFENVVDLDSDDVEIAIVSGKGNTTVSIAFPGPATGTLTVTVDGKEYSQEVVDGKAAVSITGLGEVLII